MVVHRPMPGQAAREHLRGPEISLYGRPSPDGHLLAFMAMDGVLTQVAIMKPETGNWSIFEVYSGRWQVKFAASSMLPEPL